MPRNAKPSGEPAPSASKTIKKGKSKKKIQQLKTALNVEFENIQRSAAESLPPRVITIKNVSLGGLRDAYSNRHVSIEGDPIRMNLEAFTRYPPHRKRPLKVIAEKDGGLLLYRLPADKSGDAEMLHQTISQLPPVPPSKTDGFRRSEYITRSYGLNRNSATEPFYTDDYIRDGPEAKEWIRVNESIWKRMTFAVATVSKRVFRDYQLFPLDAPGGEPGRLFGLFTRCFINQGGIDVPQSTAHRDPGEPRDGLVAIISTGNYSKGGLVFHDLGIIVETNPGDIIVFPDSVLYHSVEAVEGERNSVVCVTPNNILAYWAKKYKMQRRTDWKKKKGAPSKSAKGKKG